MATVIFPNTTTHRLASHLSPVSVLPPSHRGGAERRRPAPFPRKLQRGRRKYLQRRCGREIFRLRAGRKPPYGGVFCCRQKGKKKEEDILHCFCDEYKFPFAFSVFRWYTLLEEWMSPIRFRGSAEISSSFDYDWRQRMPIPQFSADSSRGGRRLSPLFYAERRKDKRKTTMQMRRR